MTFVESGVKKSSGRCDVGKRGPGSSDVSKRNCPEDEAAPAHLAKPRVSLGVVRVSLACLKSALF